MFEAFRMIWKNIRKTLETNHNQSANQKMTPKIPNGNHLSKKTIFAAICILSIICLSTIIEDFSSDKSVVQADSVKGIGAGIYWDQACTNKTLSLNWGFINASSSNNLTVYVRNEGNSVVSLGLNTSNWTPSATSSYIYLIWNYTDQVLSINEVIPIQLTLTVSPTIINITNFSFETTITTAEQ
jgi:hypothetical protein